MTNEFKTKYNISAKCNLRVNYYIEYTGKYTGIAYHQVLQVLYCITFCAIKIKTSV